MLFELGSLEPLLADPDIESIDYNGCDVGFLQYADGSIKPAPPIAATDDKFVAMLQMLGARVGHIPRRFDRGQPRLNLRLPDGSRLFALMDVSHRPVLSIRRHRLVRVFLRNLVELGAIDASLEAFLAALVRARKNLIIAGGTGAGKTTMLRALLNEVPPEERLVTIENAFELGLHEPGLADLHPNVAALEAREANVEGEG
jgi:Flp pilus assembly CpaF family ATPase